MYIELVRHVIEQAVDLHVSASGKPQNQVLGEIQAHIQTTSQEHRKDEPEIRYDDPLCRLAYLYMHAAANATLFERVILASDDLKLKISSASGDVLNVCSMGGGPGTELLGLAKYLLNMPEPIPPRRISFAVVDNVNAWADTWSQLADATETELRSSYSHNGVELPTVAPMFLTYDVFDPVSYQNHRVQLNKLDIVVFNYLFSENKTKLSQTQESLQALAESVGDECIIVVIDRLENDLAFTAEVVNNFESAFEIAISYETLGGTLAYDEQTSEMGKMLSSSLNWTPRVKFFTPMNREPTVFWFAFKRR